MSEAALAVGRARRTLSLAPLQRFALWALVASSCIAFVEPAPYEFLFALCLVLFLATGLRLARETMVLLVLLLAFNFGGAFALIPYLGEQTSFMFVAVSFYLGVTAVFFALVVLEDTQARLAAIEKGAVLAAVIACVAAMLGFFDVAGLGESLTRYDGSRATGMFKDPNVLGPFLVAPAAFLYSRLLAGTAARPLANLATLAFVAFGELLSFSRGAWGDFAAALALVTILAFASARRAALRRRILVISLLGVAILASLGVGALAVDKVRDMLAERASLNQSYDLGETGRFGLQRRSVPLLLEEPNGFGPLRFRAVMGQDPHNVYINAFASYGWLGGFSYLALVAATLLVGWRCVMQTTPLQAFAIPIWAALFPQIVQGLQIDTDHWRHFWMLTGLIWGIAAANARGLRSPGKSIRTGLRPPAPPTISRAVGV